MTGIPPTRIVTLVLVDAHGDLFGQLPSFASSTPWWQDAAPLVRAARGQFGLDVTILRILDTELRAAPGGAVTYLAEVDPATLRDRAAGELEIRPWRGALVDDALRRSYARPGGPAADLAWADRVLDTAGSARTGPAEQIRTWNLSSLWRLPATGGEAWLKVVPPFFAHEGRLLERLAGEALPELLGRDGQRMLLRGIPGEDQYDAGVPTLLEMIDLLVDLQARCMGRIVELQAVDLPDWRGTVLTSSIGDIVERTASELTRADRTELARLAASLPARFAAIDACGLPDSLVHGDFHPGNVRGRPGRLVLLDWGDSGIGHPLLDQPAFLTRIDQSAVDDVRTYWHAAWRRIVPGSDPDRASYLLAPVAAARQAVIYRKFLDQIEASEQAYHLADVPHWLERTAALLRAERGA